MTSRIRVSAGAGRIGSLATIVPPSDREEVDLRSGCRSRCSRMVQRTFVDSRNMMLQNPIRRVATLVLVAAMAALLVPGLVLAHAELDTPTPADKSTVTTPVTEVSGTFTQRMKVDGSTLVVKLVGGGTVAEGGVDPADDKRMVATPTSPLGSGFIPGRMDDELGRGQRGRARDMDVHRGRHRRRRPPPRR